MSGLVRYSQWAILLLLSAVLTLSLFLLHFPASLMLGPMLAGICISLFRIRLTVAKPAFSIAQALLGCFIAKNISFPALQTLSAFWGVALFITFSTLIVCGIIGSMLIRYSSLPKNTVMWGVIPGGASTMTAISADYGEDMRLVALMQYLRVIFVLISLTFSSHLFSNHDVQTVIKQIVWFPPISLNLFYTLLIAFSGLIISYFIKMPSGKLLIPMVLGVCLQSYGIVTIEIPQWLLVIIYALIGLSVGLQFNLTVIRQALRALPAIIITICAMILFCYGQALLLYMLVPIDFLSAILATSPGGTNVSVIIGLETQANLSVIMPLQILRLLSILIFGPIMAGYITKRPTNVKKVN